MATQLQLAQAEGLCLRYPENLGLHREVSFESAVNMLLRAIQMATTMPFTWGFIDKPPGMFYLMLCPFLLYLTYVRGPGHSYLHPNHSPFPNDGIRYLNKKLNTLYQLACG